MRFDATLLAESSSEIGITRPWRPWCTTNLHHEHFVRAEMICARADSCSDPALEMLLSTPTPPRPSPSTHRAFLSVSTPNRPSSRLSLLLWQAPSSPAGVPRICSANCVCGSLAAARCWAAVASARPAAAIAPASPGTATRRRSPAGQARASGTHRIRRRDLQTTVHTADGGRADQHPRRGSGQPASEAALGPGNRQPQPPDLCADQTAGAGPHPRRRDRGAASGELSIRAPWQTDPG